MNFLVDGIVATGGGAFHAGGDSGQQPRLSSPSASSVSSHDEVLKVPTSQSASILEDNAINSIEAEQLVGTDLGDTFMLKSLPVAASTSVSEQEVRI